MASRLFNPFLHSTPFRTTSLPLFAAGLGATSAAAVVFQNYRSRSLVHFDTTPTSVSARDWSYSQYQADARVPIVTPEGKLNRGAVRQLTAGSVLGLVAGLGVSFFSKPLALLIGLLVVGVQTAESYGIRLVPYGMLQRYVKSVDLRSAVQDNIAFKISFGAMFALTGFASF